MRTSTAALCAAALLVASGSALADKPAWAGNGKHGREDRGEDRRDRDADRGDDRRGTAGAAYFSTDARRIIADYYGAQARAGHCPPGLAKKHNGCLPPGQAKKWARGRALPGDVGYHDLPPDLLRRLPPRRRSTVTSRSPATSS